MEKLIETILENTGKPGYLIGLFIGGVAISIPLIIYRGFVLSMLWLWFIVPLGLPAVGWAHAVGLALIMNVSISPSSEQPSQNKVKTIPYMPLIRSFVVSSLGLLTGWILQSFV